MRHLDRGLPSATVESGPGSATLAWELLPSDADTGDFALLNTSAGWGGSAAGSACDAPEWVAPIVNRAETALLRSRGPSLHAHRRNGVAAGAGSQRSTASLLGPTQSNRDPLDSSAASCNTERSPSWTALSAQPAAQNAPGDASHPLTATLAKDADTGETLLHLAAQVGSATLVASLLHGGADASAVDVLGRTPIDVAMAAQDRVVGTPSASRYETTLALLRARNASAHPHSVAGTHGGVAMHGLSVADRRMLVDAFTALNLRDKCAVSLALGTAPAASANLGSPAVPSSPPPVAKLLPPRLGQGSAPSGGSSVGSRASSRRLLKLSDASAASATRADDPPQALLSGMRLETPPPTLAPSESKRKRSVCDDAARDLPLSSVAIPISAGPGLGHDGTGSAVRPTNGINVPTSETRSVAHALALMSAEEVLVRWCRPLTVRCF